MKDFFYSQPEHDQALQLRYLKKENTCLTLVDISRVSALIDKEQHTLLSWLTKEEKQHLQRFRFPKRYTEWLSGRIAAKCCLLHNDANNHTDRQPGDFSILPDDHGRPIISMSAQNDPEMLSISHSRQYAVAMTARQSCGIDIQHIGPQIINVEDRIASHTERTLARQISPEHRETGLTTLWAIKEALKKNRLSEHPGIFEAITIKRIIPGNKKHSWLAECHINKDNQTHIVQVAHIGHYILAWSLG